jgi:ribosomal protein L37AE/L43A
MSSDADSGTGIHFYDLASDYFCEECRRPKGNRWLLGVPSGCATCDEVISRHRCTGRPSIDERADGDIWQCPDCDSAWLVVMEKDTCGDCGRDGMEKTWTVAVPGARLDSAPRYQPYVPVPFRNLLAEAGRIASPVRPPPRHAAPGSCYQMASGALVHIKPGCRC